MTFHVMDTGPPGKGHLPEPVFPENKVSPFPLKGSAFFSHGFIITADPGHCPVKPAANAEKVFIALFFLNHTGLHPEAVWCGRLF
jgi:hypothetical protein